MRGINSSENSAIYLMTVLSTVSPFMDKINLITQSDRVENDMAQTIDGGTSKKVIHSCCNNTEPHFKVFLYKEQ